MREEIYYKVVDKKTRYGTNAAGYINKYGIDAFTEVVNKFNMYEYFPVYKDGATVSGVKGTPGIMCFNSIENAENFILNYPDIMKNVSLLKVKSRCKCKSEFKIIYGCMDIQRLLYGNHTASNYIRKGAVALNKITVIEEIPISRRVYDAQILICGKSTASTNKIIVEVI